MFIHVINYHTVPVSSSSWLLAEEEWVALSSGSLASSFAALSSSSCSRSLSEDRPPRAGALYTSRLGNTAKESTRWLFYLCCHVIIREGNTFAWGGLFIIGAGFAERMYSINRRRCGHLRLEVLLGGVFGFSLSWCSLSLMVIVSSGDSLHTKMQLGEIKALNIQDFISARKHLQTHFHSHFLQLQRQKIASAWVQGHHWEAVSHLSPDTEIKCRQSLVNLIPVTISAKQKQEKKAC